MMNKRAFTWVPSAQQWGHYASKYGPVGLAAGAGAAGTIHLMALLKGLKAEREKKLQNNDTLTVTLPAKTAAAIGPAFGKLVNHLKGNWGRYTAAGAVTGGGILGERHLNAAQEATRAANPGVQDSLSDAGGIMAVLAGTGLLGYYAVDNVLANRRKSQLQERLDKAKNEYGTLLGNTLVGKTASIEDPNEHFPIIQGICLGTVEGEFPDAHEKIAESWGSIMLGMGLTGLPVLSAILAHKWMYNRQKELELLHTQTKPSPPKQIRLVTAPPAQPTPMPSTPAPAAEPPAPMALPAPSQPLASPPTPSDEVQKAAEFPELLGALALTSNEGEGKKVSPIAAKPTGVSNVVATKAGPGTMQISTSEGPVNVEAEDPRAAALLRDGGAAKLTQLMRVFQVQPEVAV